MDNIAQKLFDDHDKNMASLLEALTGMLQTAQKECTRLQKGLDMQALGHMHQSERPPVYDTIQTYHRQMENLTGSMNLIKAYREQGKRVVDVCGKWFS